MKTVKFKDRESRGWLACVTPALFAIMLTACGGGGGGSSDDEEPEEVQRVSLTGTAVKGPLAGAEVKLYEIDWTKDDLIGEVISSGVTTETSALEGLEIDSTRAGDWTILEFRAVEGTLDINTGATPIFTRMISIVAVDDLLAGTSAYATPLTTLASNLAIENADSSVSPYTGNADGTIDSSELDRALDTASAQVLATLGFGLNTDFDLYRATPLVTDTTDTDSELEAVAAYRQAIEAVAVIANEISTDLLSGGSSPEAVFEALAEDLADGVIDGSVDGEKLALFDSVSTEDLQSLVEEDVTDKLIPGTETTVGDVEDLLVEETATTETSQSTESLESGGVSSDPEPAEVESDIDGDGVVDSEDAFPNDATETTDSDGDGVGDNSDAFPNNPGETQDSDNDGVGDNADAFPNDSSETADTDLDGVGDNADAFPNDATETQDSDLDGIGDNSDAFPNDANETTDSDSDGVGDNADAFPNDPNETADADSDGIGNNSDNCPGTPNADQADSDSDGTGDACESEETGVWDTSNWDEVNWQ